MRSGVTLRIAMWATAGLLVAIGWALYFTWADKANPIGPIMSSLADLTQPVVGLIVAYSNFPLGVRLAVVANAATYALVGALVETFRRQNRAFQTSK